MKAKLTGKQKCEMLRNIRREIAARNNIEYLTADCTYKGNCLGTCPKCDAEVRFLEYELNRKIQEGQKVVITGINDNLVKLIDQVEKAVNDSPDNKVRGNIDHLVEGEVQPRMGMVSPRDYRKEEYPNMGSVEASVRSIDELELSTKTYNRLKRNGINIVDELCALSEKELLRKMLIDTSILAEVKEKLKERGLSLNG